MTARPTASRLATDDPVAGRRPARGRARPDPRGRGLRVGRRIGRAHQPDPDARAEP